MLAIIGHTMTTQIALLDSTECLRLPDGLTYEPEFISSESEKELLDIFRELAFRTFEMHGVTAKRRVLHFGLTYSYLTTQVAPGEPIPEFLLPLREQIARCFGNEAEDYLEALINEYPAGAGIGWHRDAPVFEDVVGISIGSECRFKLRRGSKPSKVGFELGVQPRSLYRMAGSVRWEWQHSIPPAKDLRYSITFRTLRDSAEEPTSMP